MVADKVGIKVRHVVGCNKNLTDQTTYNSNLHIRKCLKKTQKKRKERKDKIFLSTIKGK